MNPWLACVTVLYISSKVEECFPKISDIVHVVQLPDPSALPLASGAAIGETPRSGSCWVLVEVEPEGSAVPGKGLQVVLTLVLVSALSPVHVPRRGRLRDGGAGAGV